MLVLFDETLEVLTQVEVLALSTVEVDFEVAVLETSYIDCEVNPSAIWPALYLVAVILGLEPDPARLMTMTPVLTVVLE
ncbi:hypothetical protein [Secundilactobacillus odoratitofui]|uniref:hypothetical protein n=1 Tax=Secundilactobacillus odoratitofui TaxID=480930 RepID=UPI0006D0B19F|nr:hypothetical protein [Secundilactobacillus odoratitofui]